MPASVTSLGDGSTTDFVIPFDYLQKSFVDVEVNGTPAAFIWFNDTTVRLTVAPSLGATVRRFRETPVDPLVVLNNTNPNPASNYHKLTTQAIHVAEEVRTTSEQDFADALAGVAADKALTLGYSVTAGVEADAAAASAAAALADKLTVAADKAIVAADKGTVAADKATVAADKALVAADTIAADASADAAAASAVLAESYVAGAGVLMASNNLSDVASVPTAKTNLGLGNVDNTSDVNKPVSTAQQTALNLKAPLANPTFTGTPAAPTAAPGVNTAQIATTAFVAALGALKANLASPTLTGVPAAPTAAPGTNTTQLATTAFVAAADALKANLASPTLTGVPAAPTAAPGTNTTQLANTAFVAAALATVDVATAIANIAYGAIGSLVFGYTTGTVGLSANGTVAGSTIEPGGLYSTAGMGDDASGSFAYATKGGAALAGTWRILGQSNYLNGSSYARWTLFLRIS